MNPRAGIFGIQSLNGFESRVRHDATNLLFLAVLITWHFQNDTCFLSRKASIAVKGPAFQGKMHATILCNSTTKFISMTTTTDLRPGSHNFVFSGLNFQTISVCDPKQAALLAFRDDRSNGRRPPPTSLTVSRQLPASPPITPPMSLPCSLHRLYDHRRIDFLLRAPTARTSTRSTNQFFINRLSPPHHFPAPPRPASSQR